MKTVAESHAILRARSSQLAEANSNCRHRAPRWGQPLSTAPRRPQKLRLLNRATPCRGAPAAVTVQWQIQPGRCLVSQRVGAWGFWLEVSQPGRLTMNNEIFPPNVRPERPASNKGKLTGPKPPL